MRLTTRLTMRLIYITLLLSLTSLAYASQGDARLNVDSSQQVVVSGAVADLATKAAILEKLRKLYGADRVIDNLDVGGVSTPANWNQFVVDMITPDLKQVRQGAISVTGNTVNIKGQVDNEATRQRLVSKLANTFNSNYTITGAMKVSDSKQDALDKTLANRTIKFESGSAVLTNDGKSILNQMAATIHQLDNPFIQIVGNTDNTGKRKDNIRLSLDRAMEVKSYLVEKGIPAASLSVSGMGPDNPIASNATEAGQARNRRIDFIISNRP